VSARAASLEERADALRREFDDSFSGPPSAAEADRVELLMIRVGPDPHAIRIAEIAGLHADRRVVRVPGPLPELLGVVNLRGAIVPVYDLRLLLGYPAGPPPRWMVVASAAPVGLAFDQLDGHAVGSSETIAAGPECSPGRSHVREVAARADGTSAMVIDLPSVVHEIRARAGHPRPSKER
jgi:purine-binding chemotaxis protein CheW